MVRRFRLSVVNDPVINRRFSDPCRVMRPCSVTRLIFCDAVVTLIQRRTPMSLSSHLQELRKKHETLSVQVEEAQRSLGTPDTRIQELKKKKLRLKEEIMRLETA